MKEIKEKRIIITTNLDPTEHFYSLPEFLCPKIRLEINRRNKWLIENAVIGIWIEKLPKNIKFNGIKIYAPKRNKREKGF